MRRLMELTAAMPIGLAMSGCGEGETKIAPVSPRTIKYMKVGSDTIVDRRTACTRSVLASGRHG